MTADDKGFHGEVLRVMSSGQPSGGDNLLGMEIDFVARLSGLHEVEDLSVSVERTDAPENLIMAECAATSGTSLERAVEAIHSVWTALLRYPFYEAHDIHTSTDKAAFRFVTQIGPGGLYVTGQVTVRASPG